MNNVLRDAQESTDMNKPWTLCKKSLYFFSSYLTQEDFSRFGRNSIETGYFLERVFPLFHTRFISVSDDYDSNDYKGDTGGMDVAFKCRNLQG